MGGPVLIHYSMYDIRADIIGCFSWVSGPMGGSDSAAPPPALRPTAERSSSQRQGTDPIMNHNTKQKAKTSVLKRSFLYKEYKKLSQNLPFMLSTEKRVCFNITI